METDGVVLQHRRLMRVSLCTWTDVLFLPFPVPSAMTYANSPAVHQRHLRAQRRQRQPNVHLHLRRHRKIMERPTHPAGQIRLYKFRRHSGS